jgi:hypothetical protein
MSYTTQNGHDIVLVIRWWLLTMEAQVQFWMTSREIHGEWSGTIAGFSPKVFNFLCQSSFHNRSLFTYHHSMRYATILTRHHFITSSVWDFVSDFILDHLKGKIDNSISSNGRSLWMTNNFFSCTTDGLHPILDLIFQVLREVVCYPWFISVYILCTILLHITYSGTMYSPSSEG